MKLAAIDDSYNDVDFVMKLPHARTKNMETQLEKTREDLKKEKILDTITKDDERRKELLTADNMSWIKKEMLHNSDPYKFIKKDLVLYSAVTCSTS